LIGQFDLCNQMLYSFRRTEGESGCRVGNGCRKTINADLHASDSQFVPFIGLFVGCFIDAGPHQLSQFFRVLLCGALVLLDKRPVLCNSPSL
jgi:hypothetical protein